MKSEAREPEKLPILISVAVISYFDHEYYHETLDSIFRQDYPYIELILSDDGSTDFDSEDVKQYVRSHKRNNILSFQIFHQQENIGTVAHAEFCRKQANGELFFLVGAGDILADSNVFSRVVHKVEKYGDDVGVFCGQTSICDEKLNHKYYWTEKKYIDIIKSNDKKKIYSTMTYKTMIPTTSVFYRMSFLDSIGGYDTTYRLIEDAPTYLRIARLKKAIVWIDGNILAKHRAGGICHSETDYNRPSYVAYTNDRINIFKNEVFPFLAQIDRNDLDSMLNLWFSGKINYIRSHGNGRLSELMIRLRLISFFFILWSMLKRKDPNAGFFARFVAFWRVVHLINKKKTERWFPHTRKDKSLRKKSGFIRRLFPPSANEFDREISTILKREEEIMMQMNNLTKSMNSIVSNKTAQTLNAVNRCNDNVTELSQAVHLKSEKIYTELKKQL